MIHFKGEDWVQYLPTNRSGLTLYRSTTKSYKKPARMGGMDYNMVWLTQGMIAELSA